MSRRVAPLSDQCLRVTHDPTNDPVAITVVPECFSWLRDEGYPIEGVENVYNAVSLKEDGNTGYLVAKVETLDYPVEFADAVEDKIQKFVCSCADYHYRQFADLDNGERPSESGECVHIQRVKRKEKVNVDSDENQQSLGDSDA